jgi:hypothetical protein
MARLKYTMCPICGRSKWSENPGPCCKPQTNPATSKRYGSLNLIWPDGLKDENNPPPPTKEQQREWWG